MLPCSGRYLDACVTSTFPTGVPRGEQVPWPDYVSLQGKYIGIRRLATAYTVEFCVYIRNVS